MGHAGFERGYLSSCAAAVCHRSLLDAGIHCAAALGDFVSVENVSLVTPYKQFLELLTQRQCLGRE